LGWRTASEIIPIEPDPDNTGEGKSGQDNNKSGKIRFWYFKATCPSLEGKWLFVFSARPKTVNFADYGVGLKF
jgi:hypothetical protein